MTNPSNHDRCLQRRHTITNLTTPLSVDVTRRLVCGGLAGTVAKTATNPLERVKLLCQTGEHTAAAAAATANAPSIKNNAYDGMRIPMIVRNIIEKEGILGLWAGNGVNVLRIFPAKAVTFTSHDIYKAALGQFHHRLYHQGDHLPAYFSFLAGGLAGVTASAVTYPLDLIHGRIGGKVAGVGVSDVVVTNKSAHKNKNMTSRPAKVYKGILHTVAVTVKDEGVWALYKGLSATLCGAFVYVGIQFGTVGALERFFPLQHDNDSDDPTITNKPLRKLLFGAVGGITAGCITYPNDTIRRLMQMQGSRGTAIQFSGYMDCARYIWQTHGWTRFYRGFAVNLLRMAPNTAVQFGTYELLKQLSAEWNLFGNDNNKDGNTKMATAPPTAPPPLVSL